MSGLRSFAFGDERNIVRALGSVLLAVSVLVILYRTSIFDPWGDLAVFLALAAPTLFLLGFGLLGGRERAGLPTGWQAAFTVVGLLLLPLALYAFLALVDGDADSNWNTIWIFGLVASASLAVALVAGVRVGCLFAAVALLVVWLALWDELLTDGIGADAGTLRWLLLAAAGLLVLLALGLDLRGHPDGGASDVIAVAGITAVVAGALSVAGAGSVIISAALAEAEAPSEIGTSTFWEAELLVVSLALVRLRLPFGDPRPHLLRRPGPDRVHLRRRRRSRQPGPRRLTARVAALAAHRHRAGVRVERDPRAPSAG